MAGQDKAAGLRARDSRLDTAERLWSLALAAVVLLVIVSASVVAASPSPTFCASCHTTESRALRASAHAGIACDRCHTGSSAFGFVQSRLRVLDMVSRQFIPSERHLVAQIDSQRCVMCHAKDLGKTTTATGIRMNHKAPLEKGWACDRCHASVAHPRKGRTAVGYTMDTCMQCHTANAKDLSSCETCHAGRSGGEEAKRVGVTPWRVTHGTNWQRTHGMGDLKTCRNCHPADYCVQCHNVNVPHPEMYMATHGRDVLGRTNGTQDCATCHRASSCDNCHGIPMPHPDAFLKVHKAEVKRLGEKACLRCHTRKSCDDCHTRHTHPGLPVDVRKWLQDRPVE